MHDLFLVHNVVVLYECVVKSTSPGRSPPSEAFSHVQLSFFLLVLSDNDQKCTAYSQVLLHIDRFHPSLFGSPLWLGHRCMPQLDGRLRRVVSQHCIEHGGQSGHTT